MLVIMSLSKPLKRTLNDYFFNASGGTTSVSYKSGPDRKRPKNEEDKIEVSPLLVRNDNIREDAENPLTIIVQEEIEFRDIHTELEGNVLENVTAKQELNPLEFQENSNMKDKCVTIKDKVIESPDLYNLEEGKFITPPNQMVENCDGNIRKYIRQLEGYMSGETQGSTHEIETKLQEIENFIEVVENPKSDIKNEFS